VGEWDSGKFTYHLEQLTDHFVTEVEGQYVLQYAGHRVIDAIVAFDHRTTFKWRLASNGVCFVCAGRVAVDYTEAAAEMEHHDRYKEFFAADHPALFYLSCGNCSFYSYVPVGIRLLDAPSVGGHLAMRAINVTERHLWEFPFVTDADVTVQNRDPWEVLVEAPTPGGRIEATLDADAAVNSITVDQ